MKIRFNKSLRLKKSHRGSDYIINSNIIEISIVINKNFYLFFSVFHCYIVLYDNIFYVKLAKNLLFSERNNFVKGLKLFGLFFGFRKSIRIEDADNN